MKFLITTILSLSFMAAAQAADVREQLVSDKTSEIIVELNNDTVICSQADYSASFLKILIPQLKDLTVFDHRNFGAGAPCVAAGMCAPFGQSGPLDILNAEKPKEKIKVNVVLKRIFSLNEEKQTCHVSLSEDVTTTVRGIKFFHKRSGSIGERLFSDCL